MKILPKTPEALKVLRKLESREPITTEELKVLLAANNVKLAD